MVKSLGILLLSLSGAAVASNAYAFKWFGTGFGQHDHRHDQGNDHNHNCHINCVVSAPEIDPASAFSALTLLGGGLLVLRGRSKNK